MTVLSNRIEFVYYFDVTNGNPNGDPDMGNMPRVDPTTQRGLVTDVCLKRKIRNFVALAKEGEDGHRIFIEEKAILNKRIEQPYEQDPVTVNAVKEFEAWRKKKSGPAPQHPEDAACAWMCRNYYDVRTFGAVMSTGKAEAGDGDNKSKMRKTAGQVRGPVQITFAQSIDAIQPLPVGITRMAVATEAEAEKQHGDNRTMGEKHIVPYALYRAHGFISPHFAKRTGFSEDDLTLFWQALVNMFDHDHSAARGKMATRKLIAFKHASMLGNAPAHVLFDLVSTERKTEGHPARSFHEGYAIHIRKEDMPDGVEPLELC